MNKILLLAFILITPNAYAVKENYDKCVLCVKNGLLESLSNNHQKQAKFVNASDRSGVISKFRLNGLSQIKYHSDAQLCEDLKFGLEFSMENKVQINDLNMGFRLMKIGELFEELAKFPEQDALIKECKERHF